MDVPSLSYKEILKALKKDGWIVVRQKGSHIRLHKRLQDRLLKLTLPAHNPVKKSTLRWILKQAEISLERFLDLLA
jgi:predicted RNA binding protein YcfA (HicA-like mRNA interferase family)